MLNDIIKDPFYFALSVIIVFIIFCLPIQFLPKLKSNKTYSTLYIGILVIIASILIIGQAIILNPKVDAVLTDEYVQFKEEEKVYFQDIKSVQLFKDSQIKLTANGFRWGNDHFYSGDANIDIFTLNDSKELSVYKAKVYINKEVDSYIVLNAKKPNKTYVFNLDTEEKTCNMYNQLMSISTIKKN